MWSLLTLFYKSKIREGGPGGWLVLDKQTNGLRQKVFLNCTQILMELNAIEWINGQSYLGRRMNGLTLIVEKLRLQQVFKFCTNSKMQLNGYIFISAANSRFKSLRLSVQAKKKMAFQLAKILSN